ncbi:hypothetical protein NC651_024388 [Populus alba x Populus x berolinensis]|nr:hypothetical protein NC651_024388 [Populus alba x Populus x berolinensis]
MLRKNHGFVSSIYQYFLIVLTIPFIADRNIVKGSFWFCFLPVDVHCISSIYVNSLHEVMLLRHVHPTPLPSGWISCSMSLLNCFVFLSPLGVC